MEIGTRVMISRSLSARIFRGIFRRMIVASIVIGLMVIFVDDPREFSLNNRCGNRKANNGTFRKKFAGFFLVWSSRVW